MSIMNIPYHTSNLALSFTGTKDETDKMTSEHFAEHIAILNNMITKIIKYMRYHKNICQITIKLFIIL